MIAEIGEILWFTFRQKNICIIHEAALCKTHIIKKANNRRIILALSNKPILFQFYSVSVIKHEKFEICVMIMSIL